MEHVFKVSEAIVDLIQTDSQLSDFAKGDFALGVDFAITAWNITLVNDSSIQVFMIDVFGRELAKTHHKAIKESKRWLQILVERKLEKYPNVYRKIGDSLVNYDEDGLPHLQVKSTRDLDKVAYTNQVRSIMPKKTQPKYGWVKLGKT